VIPADTQRYVYCRAELETLEPVYSEKWNIEHNVIIEGVKVAPTAVTNKLSHIPVLVMNNTDKHKVIAANCFMTNMYANSVSAKPIEVIEYPRDRLLDCYPTFRKSENMPMNAKTSKVELPADWILPVCPDTVEQAWSGKISKLAIEDANQKKSHLSGREHSPKLCALLLLTHIALNK